MKITVFGATGATGIQIVKQALEKGFGVKAFVRDHDKLTISNPKLEVVRGDILNVESVDKAVFGVDACLLALGAQTPILAEGTRNIISAMKKYAAKRIIVESSYAFSGSEEGIARLKNKGTTDEQIEMYRPILYDKAEQEKITSESSLEWVIVRPLALTDGDYTGKYRAGEKLDLTPESSISRADVADFMLKCVTDKQWLSKIVVISY